MPTKRLSLPLSTCGHCKQEASQYAPVGPVIITIKDPEFIGPHGIEQAFCSWACAAEWFCIQAGAKARRVANNHVLYIERDDAPPEVSVHDSLRDAQLALRQYAEWLVEAEFYPEAKAYLNKRGIAEILTEYGRCARIYRCSTEGEFCGGQWYGTQIPYTAV